MRPRAAIYAGVVTAIAIVLIQLTGRMAANGRISIEVYGALVAGACLLAGAIVLRDGRRVPDATRLETLTPRELEILRLMAEGKANKEIAVALHVEVSTIKTHANNLFAKLRCVNRREAVRLLSTQTPPS